MPFEPTPLLEQLHQEFHDRLDLLHRHEELLERFRLRLIPFKLNVKKLLRDLRAGLILSAPYKLEAVAKASGKRGRPENTKLRDAVKKARGFGGNFKEICSAHSEWEAAFEKIMPFAHGATRVELRRLQECVEIPLGMNPARRWALLDKRLRRIKRLCRDLGDDTLTEAKKELRALGLVRGARPASKGGKRKSGRPRNEKMQAVVKALLDNGELRRVGPKWKVLLDNHKDELPRGTKHNALRVAVRREQDRRAQK